MDTTMLSRINALRQMSVGELRVQWREIYGEDSRSRNKQFLFRRLAWRIQELAHGGLSDHTKQRIDELAPKDFARARTPQDAIPAAVDAPQADAVPARRDPRLPSPGTVLLKEYHGNSIRVLATEDGYEWDGRHFRSLSAVARAVTGAKWNGKLFFGLTKRRRS